MKKKTPPKKPRKPKPKTKSRLFEELIARIEATLSPFGAQVNSPDYIPDKKTASPREVDASIRYQIGSVPILKTVECRRRSKVDDATWIEQLRSKKEDIGANQTIAVSWKGFGEPAKLKAASYGIELRRLHEITTAEIALWNERIKVSAFQVDTRFTKAAIQFNPPTPGLPVADSVSEALGKEGVYAPIIFKRLDGSSMSIRSILAAWENQYGPHDKDMVLGDTLTREFRITFQPGTYYTFTQQGDKDVDFIDIGFVSTYHQVSKPLDKVSRYHAEELVFSHVAECTFVGEGGGKVEVIIPKDSPFEPKQPG